MADILPIPEINIDHYRERLVSLNQQLQDPKLSQNPSTLARVGLDYNKVSEVISTWEQLQIEVARLSQTEELLEDPDLGEMALTESSQTRTKINDLVHKLDQLTVPGLPDDEKGVIIEIRAGTGGIEASLFAEEVYRMYLRYLNSVGFKPEQISISYNPEGGLKEVSFEISQGGAFGKLRFESGVHRVQRVPTTEAKGRIHTSAISLVVLPKVEITDVKIPESDLRIDVYRSSGPGGQSVNTTDSAVRITHLPTGITVSCQDSKSQHRNKEKAMEVLASKLYTLQADQAAAEAKELRMDAIKGGDRSAKIRTFNFPQGRITDHRIKQSWFTLSAALEGDLGEIVQTVNYKLRHGEGLNFEDDVDNDE